MDTRFCGQQTNPENTNLFQEEPTVIKKIGNTDVFSRYKSAPLGKTTNYTSCSLPVNTSSNCVYV